MNTKPVVAPGGANGDNYLAIATSNSSSTISESDVIAVSNDHHVGTGTSATSNIYHFSSDVYLTGNTTYYLVFVTSNTPTNGSYTCRQSRISLNTSYGTYPYGNSYSMSSSHWLYYSAEVTAHAATTYTYKLYVNGSKFAEGTTSGFPSKTAPAAPSEWARGYVTFKYYTTYSEGTFSNPITVVPASNENPIYVDYTCAYSSLISASAGTPSWYCLSALHSGTLYDIYMDETAPYACRAKSAFDASDGYFWAFVGDPFNGFTIYNKAASGQTLYAGTSIAKGNYPSMSSENTSLWYIVDKSSDGAGRIGICPKTNTGFGLNDYGGGAGEDKLKYFTNPSAIEYVSINDVDYSSFVTANIRPYITYAGDGYFQISSDNATRLSTAISAAGETIDLEEYTALIAQLRGYIKYPTTGFYRIKNVSAETYLKAENSSQLTVGGANTDVSTVVYLVGDEGTYTSMMMQGGYVKPGNNGSAVTLGTQKTMYFKSPTVDGAVTPMQVTIGSAEIASDYLTISGSNVISWGPTSSNGGFWYVEDATSATVSLTAANDNTGAAHTYATLCVPFNVTGLTGVDSKEVKAYKPTISGNYVEPGDGATTIVAGTPVILIGAEGATSVTATIGDTYVTSPVSATSSNVLTGTFTGTSINVTKATGTNYVLGFDADNNNRIGFYHVASEEFPLKANRAYLNTSGAGDVKGFAINFNEKETAISNVKQADADKVFYDLSGRRVSQPTRGLYIVNGKKVAIK